MKVFKNYRCKSCNKITELYVPRDQEINPPCEHCSGETYRDYGSVQISTPYIYAPGGLKDWTAGKSHAEQADVYMGEDTNPY